MICSERITFFVPAFSFHFYLHANVIDFELKLLLGADTVQRIDEFSVDLYKISPQKRQKTKIVHFHLETHLLW